MADTLLTRVAVQMVISVDPTSSKSILNTMCAPDYPHESAMYSEDSGQTKQHLHASYWMYCVSQHYNCALQQRETYAWLEILCMLVEFSRTGKPTVVQ